MFSVGDSRACRNISIHDDNVCEDDPNEIIVLHLVVSGSTPNISIDPATAEVVIDDTNEPDCSKLLRLYYCHMCIPT